MTEGSSERHSALAGVVPFRRARPRLVPGDGDLGTDQELALVVACGLVLDEIARECDRTLESVYEALVRFRSDLAGDEAGLGALSPMPEPGGRSRGSPRHNART